MVESWKTEGIWDLACSLLKRCPCAVVFVLVYQWSASLDLVKTCLRSLTFNLPLFFPFCYLPVNIYRVRTVRSWWSTPAEGNQMQKDEQFLSKHVFCPFPHLLSPCLPYAGRGLLSQAFQMKTEGILFFLSEKVFVWFCFFFVFLMGIKFCSSSRKANLSLEKRQVFWY